MSDQVGNPEDRFSRVAALILFVNLNALEVTIMEHIVFRFVWLLYAIPSTAGQDVTVDTNIGTIIGEVYRGSYNATPFIVNRFLGIPFAEAPIGERRFQKPVKKAPFAEPHFVKSVPPACIQYGKSPANFSEDCLYLNVLVPGDIDNSNKRKAVLVWIYDGGFQIGLQDIYTSPTFAALNDVILVTLNYRLSIYGFLSTGEVHMTGNYGLWDQHMSIQWVHDYMWTLWRGSKSYYYFWRVGRCRKRRFSSI